MDARRKDACNRCQSLRQDYLEPAAILRELERCPVRAFKEMSGAPKSDKLAGEVVRLLLEAYYEPQFSDRSHGFRKKRGCHTALRETERTWTGTTWFIEADIADCFGTLDHNVMITILPEKIRDNRFLRLIANMLPVK